MGHKVTCCCVFVSKQANKHVHWCCVNWKALWSLGRQDSSFHSSYHVQVFYHYVEGKRTERFIADHILWVECGHWAIMMVDTGLYLLVTNWRGRVTMTSFELQAYLEHENYKLSVSMESKIIKQGVIPAGSHVTRYSFSFSQSNGFLFSESFFYCPSSRPVASQASLIASEHLLLSSQLVALASFIVRVLWSCFNGARP